MKCKLRKIGERWVDDIVNVSGRVWMRLALDCRKWLEKGDTKAQQRSGKTLSEDYDGNET